MGKISLEEAQGSQTPPAKLDQLRISAVLIDPMPLSSGAGRTEIKQDGNFVLHNLMPAAYRVNVAGLPPGTYIKSIRYGNQDITKSALDLSSGEGGSLDILLSPKAADVSGTVRDSEGKALPGVRAALWIPGTPEDVFDP
ncbi:MAG TPA: hypothetical protein VFW83_06645, partial [Bryobacteraceae bacterium]|nr:hypothetical protein [Bryobacteraceae bacterium]